MNFVKKTALTVGTITTLSGFIFGAASLSHLDPVCPQLQQVTYRALEITPIDFAVIDGWRSQAEHLKNVSKGVSWVLRSRHQDGEAIDFMAYVDGKKTWAKGKEEETYRPIVDAFKQASKELDIPITAGADWRVRDYGHIELKGKCQWPVIAEGENNDYQPD
jgi:peptidoglycan L-alanyl-D-glutamate endopeptidase CwlK